VMPGKAGVAWCGLAGRGLIRPGLAGKQIQKRRES